MSYKDKRFDPEPFLRALSPTQMAQPPCWLWHNWVRVIEAGPWAYFQCRDCFDRKAVKTVRLHGPQDTRWLEGKAWDRDPNDSRPPDD